MSLEQAVAKSKSYTTAAIIVFVLYGLLWLPGLIANFLYLQDARRMERLAGSSLPGTGCLAIMFWVNVGVTLLAVVIGCLVLFLGLVGGS